MMYQALYRKWRPQTFDEVVGQQHITETLKNQVKNNRLSHAYLFIGTRGTGKTTCARILARAVNCEHPENGNPCGRCAACRGILEGSVMDVVELDAASNNGVDNVRALREEAVFSPATVKKRVYIIDEVHMLSTAAFNALLKILEEPPAHLMFILATTELQKVPATILSRCQRHSFHRIDAKTIADYLMMIAGKEQISLRPEAAELIARLADGGVRDALSLLDQCSAVETIDTEAVYSTVGLAGKRRIGLLLDSLLRHDAAQVMREFSDLWMDGKDPASLLGELNGLLRDILMIHVAPKGALDLLSGGFEPEVLEDFSRRMTAEEVLYAMETVQNALNDLREARNPRTAAELCLAKLCCDPAGESFTQLRARISRLEEQMERGVPVREQTAGEAPYREKETTEENSLSIPPEDELEVFQEEQPEDVFLKREAPSPQTAAAAAPSSPNVWKSICRQASSALPVDLRLSLEDETRVRGSIEGKQLVLEVLPGFLYNRFNRQEILSRFAEAARTVTGGDLHVLVRELQPRVREKRSLEELRQFKEVHFISE